MLKKGLDTRGRGVVVGREATRDEWREAWDLKVFGFVNLTREIYRSMCERRDGVIVNVIGIGGEKLEYAYAAGSTGNAALAAMTRAVGSVSLDYGVRVLGVHPGWVETERARRSLRRRAEQELGDAERGQLTALPARPRAPRRSADRSARARAALPHTGRHPHHRCRAGPRGRRRGPCW